MRRLIQLVALCLVAGTAGGAWAVCSGTCNGAMCDASCTSSTCPTVITDSCPGHCLVTPGTVCNSDADCPGSSAENPCHFNTTDTFGHCSTDPTVACVSSGQCPSSGTCGAPFTPYGGDGVIAICGTGGANTINGTDGNDVICGNGGNDTIDAKQGTDLVFGDAGDDTIYGGGGTDTIYGGDGNDYILATSSTFFAWGNDFVDGGDGDDQIIGSGRALLFGVPTEGDNVLIGGNGNDWIASNSGRDVIKGGDGDDDVGTVLTYAPQLIDDVVGTLICGGDGDDYLVGYGASHQCMDGGAGADQCLYQYWVSGGTQDATDFGSGRSCETSTGLTAGRSPSCGCEPG